MRKKIVAGNWKMNKNRSEAINLVTDIMQGAKNRNADEVSIIIAPPYPYLTDLVNIVADHSNIEIAAQDCSQHESGAYTGDVSAAMIASTGATCVIIGHSERRSYHNESSELLSVKVRMALKAGLKSFFCCGESLEQRESGRQQDVVKKQLEESLFHLSDSEMNKIAIAYEPVWAIGTGQTATADQAQEMHSFIRDLLKQKYSAEVANDCSILYGGSCNENNAAELFSKPDIDGGLIGGASLNADNFIAIADSFNF